MGTNYGQTCMVGVRFERNALKKIISPAEYRDEPRYDTWTGKQTGTERILVKREYFVYEVFGVEYDHLYGVEIKGLYCNDGYGEGDGVFIGIKIGDEYDCGRVDLLQGSVSLKEISEKAKIVSEKLNVPIEDIGVHFITYVG